jgi:hypothetical protein
VLVLSLTQIDYTMGIDDAVKAATWMPERLVTELSRARRR